MRQGLANRILHEAIARGHDALFSQEMHELPENINGSGRNHGGLARLCRQRLALFRIACPVTKERKNQALLSQPRHLGDIEVAELKVGEILGLDMPRVLFHVGQIEDKKEVVRLDLDKRQVNDAQTSNWQLAAYPI